MTIDFENNELIDSRDLIDRIEELESIKVIDREPDEQDELDELYEFAEEAQNVTSEWEHGATLIRDDHFEDYARELVTDIGYIPEDLPGWIEINWEATADNLKTDYSSIEFRGETFWVRS